MGSIIGVLGVTKELTESKELLSARKFQAAARMVSGSSLARTWWW